jgi:transcriptional regulator of aromatic amino acid metabolism
VVGNSLLIYGGYNGNYLQDFEYLTLKNAHQPISISGKVVMLENTEDLIRKLSKLEKQQDSDFVLTVKAN